MNGETVKVPSVEVDAAAERGGLGEEGQGYSATALVPS